MVQSLWWITSSLRQGAAHRRRLQHRLQPQLRLQHLRRRRPRRLRLLQRRRRRHAWGDARQRHDRAPLRHRGRHRNDSPRTLSNSRCALARSVARENVHYCRDCFRVKHGSAARLLMNYLAIGGVANRSTFRCVHSPASFRQSICSRYREPRGSALCRSSFARTPQRLFPTEKFRSSNARPTTH